MDETKAPLNSARSAPDAQIALRASGRTLPASGRTLPAASGLAAPARRDAAPLAKLLQRQHYVITRGQALACGLSHDTVQRRVRAGGPWQRLLPGVYLALTGTPTQDQRDTAALLYAGAGSVLTGTAALRRHGLRAPRSQTVDVLIPAKRRRQNAGYVAVHLTTRIPSRVCYLGPVQYALAARAVADAARGLDDLAEVRALVAAAVQTGRCTVKQLAEELQAGPVRRSALFRVALAEAAQGVRSATEADMMNLIKRGQLPTPLFNPRLFSGNELLGIADAWWPDAGLVVEVDSREWHLSPDGWERTMRRHARMTAQGLLVLHFTPRQIRDEPDDVLRTIRLALASRRGQPVPVIRTLQADG